MKHSLQPRAGGQAFMGTPAPSLATSNSAPRRFPAYPGTQINHPVFNLTFPRAENYYAVQLTTSTYYYEKDGEWVSENITRWTTPPEHYMVQNKWPAVWEMDDSFIEGGKQGSIDRLMPEVEFVDVMLEVLRYDPVSGTSDSVGAAWPWWAFDFCAYFHYPDQPSNSCLLDNSVLAGISSYFPLEQGFVPGDNNYFVAVMNYSSPALGFKFMNYISVSELFSVKNTSTIDPNRPDWVTPGKDSGAAHLSVPSVVALLQLVLVLSSVFAWV